MNMSRHPSGAGLAFLGPGAAFLAIAVAGGQPAFLGVGLAFIGLAVGFLSRTRGQDRRR